MWKQVDKWNKKVWSRTAGAVLALILILGSLTSCGGGSGTRVIFTTGFGKNQVFRIADISCTVPELMVYLVTTQNQYESVYGKEVWNVSLDGISLEENVKETVLAKIAQIKTMFLLAREKGISLDEAEQKKVEQATEEYWSSLSERERELLGVERETILTLYREYALANKVYAHIIQDINPEISDDEARTITVQHILFRTYTKDVDGNRVDYDGDRKNAVYEKACEIRELAASGEQDFADLASRYSEDSELIYSFGKGEMDLVFEETAFQLETNEVSRVFETDAGYHIIKCISTFDREQTDLNKEEIVEQRRREVFGEEYDAFAGTLIRQLNQERWEEIALVHDDEVTTTSFFEVYNDFFQ